MGKCNLQYNESDCNVVHESIFPMLAMCNKLAYPYTFGDDPSWVA